MNITDYSFGKLEALPSALDLALVAPPARKSLTVPFKRPEEFGLELWHKEWPLLANARDPSLSARYQSFPGCGDCVLAAFAHQIQLLGAATGSIIEFDSYDTLDDYITLTGYDPITHTNDSGLVVRAAMEYWNKIGIVNSSTGKRHKIARYGKIPSHQENLTPVVDALWTFGTVGVGLRLTATLLQQFINGETWTDTDDNAKIGGHYVPLVAFRNGMFGFVSWGRLCWMTTEVFRTKVDEIWITILPEMFLGGRTLQGTPVPEMLSLLQPQ